MSAPGDNGTAFSPGKDPIRTTKFNDMSKFIKVQLAGAGDGNKITLEVKPHTTMRRLREYWAQHLEWQDPDVAIDISRITLSIPEDLPPTLDQSVDTLPVAKKCKLPDGQVQDLVCLTAYRSGPRASTTAHGFAAKLKYVKKSATPVISLVVRTLTGKTITFPVKRSATTLDIKAYIQYREGYPVDQQRIIHKGQQLIDDLPVGFYVHDDLAEAELHVVLRLRGC